MIIIYIIKYRLWWFACLKVFQMMYPWRHLWLGKRIFRLMFSPRYSEGVCRYMLMRLHHFAPVEVFRTHEGSDLYQRLETLMKKHKLDDYGMV